MALITFIVVVQARMGSTRLPGKVLMDLEGYKLIDHVLHRALAPLDESKGRVVLATTTNSVDNELVDYVSSAYSIPVTRGPEDNVLGRFIQALDEHGRESEFVVRITADDPLRENTIAYSAVDTLGENKALVAAVNDSVAKFPLGVETEVCRADALRSLESSQPSPEIQEHIFPYFRNLPDHLIHRIGAPGNLSVAEALTVDTVQDITRLRTVFREASSKLGKSPLDLNWSEVLPYRISDLAE